MSFNQKLAQFAAKLLPTNTANRAKLLSYDTSGDLVAVDNYFSFRNKFINGNMRVNQRSSISTTSSAFLWDRWGSGVHNNGMAGLTATTSTNSANNPSLTGGGCLSMQNGATTRALTAPEYYGVYQIIEGYLLADLLWGTSSAKPITLSFRAYSSHATTMPIGFRNGASNRSYVASVTLPVGYSTQYVTIPGDTSGTWDKSIGGGLSVYFTAATGSDYHASAMNTWTSSQAISHASMPNFFANANAQIVIADVQLEQGTIPTPFEIRPYDLELRMCYRYFQRLPSSYAIWSGKVDTGNLYYVNTPILAPMRTTPAASNVTSLSQQSFGSPTVALVTPTHIQFGATTTATVPTAYFYGGCDLSAEF